MGNNHAQSIKQIDVNSTPIYCMGFASDIHFASQDAKTNEILAKLKQYEHNQMFKYRIREHALLEYFCQYAHLLILLRPYGKQQNAMGIVSISKKYQPRAQNIMIILRRQLKVDEKESIFLYNEGKLCQTHQLVCQQQVQKQKSEYRVVVLYYSKMEISG